MTDNLNPLDFLADLIAGGKKELNKTAADKAREKAEKQKAARLAKERAKWSPVATALSDPDFVPVSNTVQMIRQHCNECKTVTEFVGAVTIQEKHKRLPAFREVNKPLNSNLPVNLRYHDQRVPCCVGCLDPLGIGDYVPTEYSHQQMELF